MLMLIMLGYVGLVLIAFKVIKIRVSPISIAAAALIGVFVLSGILIAWKFSAPMTSQMTLHRKVIQLVSNQQSKELITGIRAGIDQPVKEGDPLYTVESKPNQYAVDMWTAKVAVAEQKILEAQAAIDAAAAQVDAAKADRALKKAQLNTALETRKLNPAAISELTIQVTQQAYNSSEATVNQAAAAQQAAVSGLATARNNLSSDQAQLDLAKLNLGQNVVRAPVDGTIINWQTVEGTMTTTVASSAQGTFMATGHTRIAAVYPENLLKNVAAGNTVEIAFRSLPGKIVNGKVTEVLDFTGEGQLLATGQVPSARDLGAKGYLVVAIKLDDPEMEASLPLGAAGTVAIYTDVLKPFQLVSKISLRMKMWLNYLPL